MRIQIRVDQMENVEGLSSQYPFCIHHVDLTRLVVPWHWHEALEFIYVVEGCLKASTPTASYVFHKGQGLFINSKTLATMVNVEQCILDSFLFHPVFLSGHFNSIFETKYILPVLQNQQLELVCFPGETENQRRILGKLRQLSQLQAQPDNEFFTRNLLSEIWMLLLEEIRTMELSVPSSTHSKDRILTMIAYIQEHYREKLTLEQIAASAAISSRECLRCFRTTIQQTPIEYLIGYRITQAKKLLETTSLSVTEIALRCGFSAPAYFTKVFGQQTGETPLAYRKK